MLRVILLFVLGFGSHASHADNSLEMGRNSFDQGRYSDAVKHFERGFEKTGDFYFALFAAISCRNANNPVCAMSNLLNVSTSVGVKSLNKEMRMSYESVRTWLENHLLIDNKTGKTTILFSPPPSENSGFDLELLAELRQERKILLKQYEKVKKFPTEANTPFSPKSDSDDYEKAYDLIMQML